MQTKQDRKDSINVRIKRTTHKKLKVLCAQKGMQMTELIEFLLKSK